MIEQNLALLRKMPEEAMKLFGLTEEQYDARIAELEGQLGASKKGSMRRRKGSNYERKIAKKFLESWGIKLVRTPSSGGFRKDIDNELIRGDLSCLDDLTRLLLHIECKDHVTWKPKEWFSQALSDCPADNIPVVIMHQGQKIVEGKRKEQAEDFIMLRLSDFLSIADQSKLILKTEE